jgi:DNA-binding MarR family transcriptional regulator
MTSPKFTPPCPGGCIVKTNTDTNTANGVSIRPEPWECAQNGQAWDAVARTHKFVHLRFMPGQHAIEGEIQDKAVAAGRGDEAPLKLEQFLPYQLNVVSNLVSQALSRVYSRRYRIGVPEWRVLVTLGQYGVMTGKAIGAHTHMHKTKVSRAVALLEKRRLVARRVNRADMREAFLSLTAPGRAIYEELAPHALEFARQLTDILSPGDRDTFNRALQQITDRSAQLGAETDDRGGHPSRDAVEDE